MYFNTLKHFFRRRNVHSFDVNSGDMTRFLHTSVQSRYRLLGLAHIPTLSASIIASPPVAVVLLNFSLPAEQRRRVSLASTHSLEISATFQRRPRETTMSIQESTPTSDLCCENCRRRTRRRNLRLDVFFCRVGVCNYHVHFTKEQKLD